MARPTEQPYWATQEVTPTTEIPGVGSVTYTNKIPVPQQLKDQGLLSRVPVAFPILNQILDELCTWVRYLDVAEETTLTDGTTARTLALTDQSKCVSFTSSSATTVTVPLGVFPLGAKVGIRQDSTGQVTITGASGVTVKAPFGLAAKTAGNGAELWITKRSQGAGVETWTVFGQAGA